MTGPTAYAPHDTAYLMPGQPDPAAARIRLLCFHHAGGAGSSFATWQQALPPDVAVVPVQLPGREHRAREPRFRELDPLVADLNDRLGTLLDLPHSFYGHSMGGLIAHALAAYRHTLRLRPPEQLIVGAVAAPHAPRPQLPVHDVPDDELIHWMISVGGVPELVLRYPDWVAKAAALLRDDLVLAASHRPRTGERLPCPIHVLAGSSDPLLSVERAADWDRHTSAGCRVHVINGGHFFTRENSGTVTGLLGGLLSGRP
ncbi:thioesterase II family protein [Streptomyces hokutonensis]|uniref:thioesterase II family protein n=1 Tax=Streptomyces hokutonensis TaxID=1306990 RepID=UPI0033EE25D8